MNLKESKFSFAVNDKETQVVFTDIEKSEDITYKMVLQMTLKGTMKIINFVINE